MMFENIWGLKTVAMFDVWSIEHLLSGLSVGHIVIQRFKKYINNANLNGTVDSRSIMKMEIISLMGLAYWWETLEHYLEVGLAGEAIEYWFQGVEIWTNRLVADPLLVIAGYFIVRRYPRWVIPVRFISLIWIFVHVFIFPHSMQLHYIF